MIKLDKYDIALLMDALQSYACGEIDFTNIYTSIRLYDKIGSFASEADGKEILLCTDDEVSYRKYKAREGSERE